MLVNLFLIQMSQGYVNQIQYLKGPNFSENATVEQFGTKPEAKDQVSRSGIFIGLLHAN